MNEIEMVDQVITTGIPLDIERRGKRLQIALNDIFIKKIGKMVVLIPKDDPWSPLINSLDQFTDDFMNNRNDRLGTGISY